MRPKITEKEWDKIVQDAFSAGAPDPHFSEKYYAKRRKLERKLAMKEERKNAFQPGLVLATVGALLIAAVPAGMIVMMNRAAAQPKPDPGAAVMETFAETVTETEETAETGVAVPDLTGYRYEYARKVLEQEGFEPSLVYECNDDFMEGSVIRIEPVPDTVQQEGSTVTLYVSKGEDDREVFEMPDVKGLQQQRAEVLLEYYGMMVEIIYESSEEPVWTVIGQSNSPGDPLPSGSTVQLTVSAGANTGDMIEMPDLRGLQQERAEELLKYYGMNVEIVYESSEERSGTVIGQSNTPGEELPTGSSVQITVSELKKAAPTQPVMGTFEMPDVIGMNEEQAKALLEHEYGMTVEIVYEPSESYPGTVRAQSIEPWTETSRNSTVTLTVAAEN